MSEALERAHESIRLLEEQLQQQVLAESHPRWTVTGELVLIGDIGTFSRPDGSHDEGRVVLIDGESADVFAVVGQSRMSYMFNDCAELISRQRMPRVDQRNW